jgi:hypothetical protein
MSTPKNLQRGVRAAALALAFALPAASVALAQDATEAPAGGWYANINNPHPELPGFPKIARADNKIYANLSQPHPEITEAGAGVFATTGSGAVSQAAISQANASK